MAETVCKPTDEAAGFTHLRRSFALFISAGYIYTPQPLLEGGGTGEVPVGPVGPSASGKVTHYGWEAALGRTETDGPCLRSTPSETLVAFQGPMRKG